VGYGDGLVHHAAPGSDGRRSFGRKLARFIVLVIVAGLVWSAWAAAGFYDLAAGLRDDNSVALERRIDWVSVRQALREDLQSGPITPSGGRGVDSLTSRGAIAQLLRTAKLDPHGWEAASSPPERDHAAFAWRRIRYAFFTGGPATFRVDLNPDGGPFREPLVLLFRWSGDWRLTRIFLPAPGQPELASQPSPVAAPPAAGAAAPPSGSAQATLYEDDLDDKGGKSSTGTVSWRAAQSLSATGGAASLAVIAHVRIPARPLDMTMTIRRNLDPALPATHMFEINFVQPAETATDGITGIAGVSLKPDEASPGQNLTGSHVKVRDGFFLLGLSALAADVDRNVPLLKEQPWFGIPIRFRNGNRGVLVIEKGEAGRDSLAEAFAQWDASASVSKK
jgi:hypothetical protein